MTSCREANSLVDFKACCAIVASERLDQFCMTPHWFPARNQITLGGLGHDCESVGLGVIPHVAIVSFRQPQKPNLIRLRESVSDRLDQLEAEVLSNNSFMSRR